MFRLRNDDSRSAYEHRAEALAAATLRAWWTPAVYVDEYDGDGDYVGTCVMRITHVHDPSAPPRWPRHRGE